MIIQTHMWYPRDALWYIFNKLQALPKECHVQLPHCQVPHRYKQLLANLKDSQLTILKLESYIEELKSELDWEVNNVEKFSNSLYVSKALVNTLNIKYGEVVEHLKRRTKTVEGHISSVKALKKTNMKLPD